MPRKQPNIAISGVPGTGKSTLCARLAKEIPGLKVIDMGAEAEQRGCRDEYDDKLQTWVIDEDKLTDALAPTLDAGGNIVDWMHADMWAPRALDLVVTLRTDNTALYDRYAARGYAARKVGENLDAEIMNTIGEENAAAFGEDDDDDEGTTTTTTLVELQSNTNADMRENVRRVKAWVEAWKKDQQKAA